MKLIKPSLFISSVMALALTGCSTTSSVLNLTESTPITIENAVKIFCSILWSCYGS